MAIVQISQIQVRRGLNQDLPQLASGEMGWSTDTRQLYIGNGVTGSPDYAPVEGFTEILTQHSNFLNSISNYTFAGTDSGYTSQTGASSLTPVSRTLQSVLDDILSIRDFGAVGDNATDNTDAINRAISQVYPASLNPTHAPVRRTIKFPAGTYLVSGPIKVPPNCTLVGDGRNNTIISATTGTVLITCDAAYNVGGAMSGTYPSNISISGITFATGAGTNAVVQIDSAVNVVFDQCYIYGPSTVLNLVNTTSSTVNTTKAITLNACVFDGGTNGVSASGTTAGLRVTNSFFINNSTNGIKIPTTLTGLVSQNNYFDGSVPTAILGLTGDNFSYGDVVAGSSTLGGINVGSAKIGVGNTFVLSNGTNSIGQLAVGAGLIDYQLTDGSSYRFGTLKFNKPSSGSASFDDDYTEPSSSLGANLFVNHTGILSCAVTTTTTFKYNIKQFI